MDPKRIYDLSATGRHQECLQACQQVIQSEPENPLPWKFAGKSLLALRQFEKAQQYLTKAHQLDTKDPETTKDIGNIFLNLGRTEDATEWYKKSLNINNNYAPAINNIANIKRQSDNNQEAFNLFKQAIQADPQLIQAYAGAAASSLALGDLDQAETFAIRAIEINANAPGINEILGIVFQNKRNSRQAIKSYKKELVINPKSNTSLLNLGLLLLQQGEAAAAIEPLAKAAAIIPGEQCSLLLAQAYQNIGKLKEAVIEYKKIDISKTQNKLIPFNLGICLLNTGNNIDAIEAIKIAIKLDESFLPAWGNIGTALMNEGRHQEALAVMQKVLELDPKNPTAHMNLGAIYQDLGNLDHALVSTLKSLELNPDNPVAHMNLGNIYKDLGNLDQALASTLKSLELKPDNPLAHMNLGGIYKNLGKRDQALASTLKSLELKPDNPNALTNLGGIYQDLGNLEQALASTLKSLELNPDNPDAHINLGQIYFEKGDHQRAEVEFGQAIGQNRRQTHSLTRGKAACSFFKKEYNKAIELLETLPSEEYTRRKSPVSRDTDMKSVIDAKLKGEIFLTPTRELAPITRIEGDKSLIKVSNRVVEDSLIAELYDIRNRKLSEVETNDGRYGSGFCTDFNLLSNTSPKIKQLMADLKNIIKNSLHKEPCSLKYDSFFNIFKAGAGTTPHIHLNSQDKSFDLWKHKYSLVYYLEPGDQDCDQPGILKMYDPEIQILPEKGMIVIIPATRMHSSCYGGSKDRLMVGVNFYAFDLNTEKTFQRMRLIRTDN